jgi:hypothetical protein
LTGKWRLTVIQKQASYSQRFKVSGSAGTDGTYSGNVGSSVVINGNEDHPWTITIEHNDGSSGWQPSEVKERSNTQTGSQIEIVIESEDKPVDGDRDFTDCVIKAEKIGMIDVPSRGNAIWPTTMQMMPEGIFEKALERYFLAIRVKNIWTRPWPAGASLGLTQSSRQALANRGIVVSDAWDAEDQAAVDQEIVMSSGRARVIVGALGPWNTQLIYFKLDVSGVAPSIHTQSIELDVLEPGAPDPGHTNRKTSSKIWISQTTYDPDKNVFVSECDIGRMTAAIREITVDYRSLKRAVGKARELFGTGQDPWSRPPTSGEPGQYCSKRELELLRRELLDFLRGKEVDICQVWRRLQCCCAMGGFGGRPGDGGPGEGPWSKTPPTGMEIVSVPNAIDYTIDYNQPFAGKHGPIPYEDPWWKILLIIIAIILTIAAAASAAADLANRSSDTVIGQVTRAVLDAPGTQPDAATIDVDDRGSVDAAVVSLNGNRSLTGSIFSYLDAHGNEDNTDPVNNLDGRINTNGAIITNDQINQLFQDISDTQDDINNNQGNVIFLEQLRDQLDRLMAQLNVFKSGARTGTTKATLVAGIDTISPRRTDNGGRIFFINQLNIVDRGGAEVSNSGDSGSLWLIEDAGGDHRIIGLNHAGCTNLDATASRIEDVMEALKIRFA